MCLKMSFNVQTGGDVIQNVTKTYVPFNGIYRSWNFLEAGWIVFEIWSFQRGRKGLLGKIMNNYKKNRYKTRYFSIRNGRPYKKYNKRVFHRYRKGMTVLINNTRKLIVLEQLYV